MILSLQAQLEPDASERLQAEFLCHDQAGAGAGAGEGAGTGEGAGAVGIKQEQDMKKKQFQMVQYVFLGRLRPRVSRGPAA